MRIHSWNPNLFRKCLENNPNSSKTVRNNLRTIQKKIPKVQNLQKVLYYHQKSRVRALQHGSKIGEKSIKKCDFIFDQIFHRFLIDLGSKNPSKILQKSIPKWITKLIAFGIASRSIFGGILASQTAPV